jgi:hypothetical protein
MINIRKRPATLLNTIRYPGARGGRPKLGTSALYPRLAPPYLDPNIFGRIAQNPPRMMKFVIQ